MSVRSQPTSARQHRVGFLRPAHIERAFVFLLYLVLLALVLLSVLGTFYGQLGRPAPITVPAQIWQDMSGASEALAVALGVQFVLTTVQYGARQFAHRDRRWWILYLVALGISVYYNFQAYWTPVTAIVPWYAAILLIVAGDVLPEFLAVRRE